jgi:D-apiose dehydrogenase
MSGLRFAIFGAGFWAGYQLAAWRELKGVECVAVYNRTASKADELAKKFGISKVYADPAQLLAKENLDFVDVITDVDSHVGMVRLAGERGLPVICQKPMAPTLEEAMELVEFCREKRAPLFVHENWRWQTPIRQLYRLLAEGEIGTPFRARIDMISGFPVFENQPFLKNLKQFIVADLGTHILDVARFLFGEAHNLYCQTKRLHPDIKGEDVATVMMRMGRAETTVLCQMAYAENPLEREVFPQTLIFVEGDKGSLELCPDYWIRLTTDEGTLAKRYPPPRYAWANPAYDVVQASIVECHRNLLGAISGKREAETTGEDNLKTLRLVFGAYESADRDKVLNF